MIKLAYPDGHRFIYATRDSVGFDICSNEAARILPDNWQFISTGLRIVGVENVHDLSENTFRLLPELQIRSRSGLVRSGIYLFGGTATIDPDYSGEIMISLKNEGRFAFNIQKGDRIAQGVCVLTMQLKCLEVLDVKRGDRGFGSTGTK